MGSRRAAMALGTVMVVALGMGIILALTSGFNGADATGDAQAADPTPAATLGDLNSVDGLKVLFNEDDGSIRVVLLLSPT